MTDVNGTPMPAVSTALCTVNYNGEFLTIRSPRGGQVTVRADALKSADPDLYNLLIDEQEGAYKDEFDLTYGQMRTLRDLANGAAPEPEPTPEPAPVTPRCNCMAKGRRDHDAVLGVAGPHARHPGRQYWGCRLGRRGCNFFIWAGDPVPARNTPPAAPAPAVVPVTPTPTPLPAPTSQAERDAVRLAHSAARADTVRPTQQEQVGYNLESMLRKLHTDRVVKVNYLASSLYRKHALPKPDTVSEEEWESLKWTDPCADFRAVGLVHLDGSQFFGLRAMVDDPRVQYHLRKWARVGELTRRPGFPDEAESWVLSGHPDENAMYARLIANRLALTVQQTHRDLLDGLERAVNALDEARASADATDASRDAAEVGFVQAARAAIETALADLLASLKAAEEFDCYGSLESLYRALRQAARAEAVSLDAAVAELNRRRQAAAEAENRRVRELRGINPDLLNAV